MRNHARLLCYFLTTKFHVFMFKQMQQISVCSPTMMHWRVLPLSQKGLPENTLPPNPIVSSSFCPIKTAITWAPPSPLMMLRCQACYAFRRCVPAAGSRSEDDWKSLWQLSQLLFKKDRPWLHRSFLVKPTILRTRFHPILCDVPIMYYYYNIYCVYIYI